jgi:hypothetical protein
MAVLVAVQGFLVPQVKEQPGRDFPGRLFRETMAVVAAVPQPQAPTVPVGQVWLQKLQVRL